jgi:competence protein ComEC
MSEAHFKFWDVQHGHALYLKTPNGRHIVTDLGTGSYNSGSTFSPLNYLYQSYGVSQLDYVIITHPHVDHIDDIFNFDSLDPKVLMRPKHLDKEPILANASNQDKPKIEKFFEISDRYCESVLPDGPNSTSNPNNWGGLSINTFTPYNCSQSNLNNHSVVTVFSLNGIKVLIPGDNEPASWNELKDRNNFLRLTKDVDILLASHHGRKSGFDMDMIKHFNPRLTIISDGAYVDTSASSRYSELSRGWKVFNHNGYGDQRYCLTTRNDGVINVEIGEGSEGSPFLFVKTGK